MNVFFPKGPQGSARQMPVYTIYQTNLPTIPDTKFDYGISSLQYKSAGMHSPNVILFEVWGIWRKEGRLFELSIVRIANYFSIVPVY